MLHYVSIHMSLEGLQVLL